MIVCRRTDFPYGSGGCGIAIAKAQSMKFWTSVYKVYSAALAAACVAAIATTVAEASVVDITSPTTTWTPVLYANNNPDPSKDQQTGSAEGDIVGNALNPSVFTTFGNGNTPSLIDGTLAFRIRIGADMSPAGFKTAVFVGIDGNSDGALDLFLGVNNSGAGGIIGIWDPGTGTNTSPSSTTIVSTPLASYTQAAANYSWMQVTATNDPNATSFDLDAGGPTEPDFFLSYSIPFADVVAKLAANGITGFNENSTMSYVVATATQANSLNQDLNGVAGSVNSSLTWSQLGVQSNLMTPAGIAVVPEMDSALGIVGLLVVVIAHHHFRRRCSRAI